MENNNFMQACNCNGTFGNLPCPIHTKGIEGTITIADDLIIKIDAGRCICCHVYTKLKTSYLCAGCLGDDTRKIDGLIWKLIDKIQKNNTALQKEMETIHNLKILNARHVIAIKDIEKLLDNLEKGSSSPDDYKLLELRKMAHKPFREIIKKALKHKQ